MKKVISLILIILFVTACGNKQKQEEFYLNYNNKEIRLDVKFDVNVQGQYNDLFESVNCAFGDRDITYFYDGIEIETYGNESNELIIYSIRLISEDVKTNENIGLYDEIESAIKAYGDDYVKNDNEYVYKHGKTSLVFITNNGIIESIEYQLNNLI